MIFYTHPHHKRVQTRVPTAWIWILLLSQWLRLRPAVMRRGKTLKQIPKAVCGQDGGICTISAPQAGGCEERDVFWQSKAAVPLSAVRPV